MKKLLTLLLVSTFCLALASIVIGGKLATSNNTVLVSSLPSPSDSEQVLTPPEKSTSETTPPATPPAAAPLTLKVVINWIAGKWAILASLGVGALASRVIEHYLTRRRLRLTHEHRIVESMADKFHMYTEKYFMPIISIAGRLYRELKERTTQTAKDERKEETQTKDSISFFYLALLIYYWHILSLELGGYFLKDTTVAKTLWVLETETMRTTSNWLNKKNESILIESIREFKQSFITFINKLGDKTLSPIFKDYESWLGENVEEVRKSVDYLQCYRNLFLFEINIPYEAWSGKSFLEKPDLVKNVINELQRRNILTDKDKTTLFKKIKRYGY